MLTSRILIVQIIHANETDSQGPVRPVVSMVDATLSSNLPSIENKSLNRSLSLRQQERCPG
jgi:hypothetical protein